MIHVVFQQADIEALQKSFELDASLKGEIILIKDDYAVGPLKDIYSAQGIENRINWWKTILHGGHYEGIADDGHVNDNKEVTELIAKLQQNIKEVAWIWVAPNKHDISGYYWLTSQLKNFQEKVFVLHLNNLPFINEKGNIFYPTSLFQIPPKEFVKAKKLARAITLSEFETDTDEWKKICSEDKGVRILEGGKKLLQKGYDYYDSEILKFSGKEWQKTLKLLTQYYSKVKDTTGDAYMLWRLHLLAEQGKLQVQGNRKNMKEFEVRLAQAEIADAQLMAQQIL